MSTAQGSKIRFACPACGKKCAADEKLAYKMVPCPNCKARILVPMPTEQRYSVPVPPPPPHTRFIRDLPGHTGPNSTSAGTRTVSLAGSKTVATCELITNPQREIVPLLPFVEPLSMLRLPWHIFTVPRVIAGVALVILLGVGLGGAAKILKYAPSPNSFPQTLSWAINRTEKLDKLDVTHHNQRLIEKEAKQIVKETAPLVYKDLHWELSVKEVTKTAVIFYNEYNGLDLKRIPTEEDMKVNIWNYAQKAKTMYLPQLEIGRDISEEQALHLKQKDLLAVVTRLTGNVTVATKESFVFRQDERAFLGFTLEGMQNKRTVFLEIENMKAEGFVKKKNRNVVKK